MSYTRIKKLPSVEEIIAKYPLSNTAYQKILQDRREIKEILEGKNQRLLMIIGPCSAWPKEAVLEYANRLKAIDKELSSHIKLVMRMYIQKPRTIKGWTGPVNQPDPYEEPDIVSGVHYCREMMVKVVEMGLPIADECLFTHNARGFSELVSWFAIGARSSEDYEHRIFASAAHCGVGMKNPTHGVMEIAINSVVAAQHGHTAAMDGYEVKTFGNPHAHLVLRGSNSAPNYSLSHIEEAYRLMSSKDIKNPAIIIDASHDNCLMNGKKAPALQPLIISKVLDELDTRPDLRKLLKGFMVESYLKEGNQSLDACKPSEIDLGGLSITDPCLGWDETEEMLFSLKKRLG